jgi:enoyl-CoA hydratase
MSEIRLDLDPPVATISLAAPERRNALTPAMAQELIEACESVDADERIGAVVVRGDGDVFCAGGDRATLAEIGTTRPRPRASPTCA